MLDRLREVGILTPQEYQVPRGFAQYEIVAKDSDNNLFSFFISIESSDSQSIRNKIYDLHPDVVDYTFKRLSEGTIQEIGRKRALSAAAQALMITPSTAQKDELEINERIVWQQKKMYP